MLVTFIVSVVKSGNAYDFVIYTNPDLNGIEQTRLYIKIEHEKVRLGDTAIAVDRYLKFYLMLVDVILLNHIF